MHRLVGILALFYLASCASNTVSSETAALSAENAAAREAAQAGRIENPEALACLRASASDAEWAIIAGQDSNAEAELQTVMNREDTIRCFNENQVVVYL